MLDKRPLESNLYEFLFINVPSQNFEIPIYKRPLAEFEIHFL